MVGSVSSQGRELKWRKSPPERTSFEKKRHWSPRGRKRTRSPNHCKAEYSKERRSKSPWKRKRSRSREYKSRSYQYRSNSPKCRDRLSRSPQSWSDRHRPPRLSPKRSRSDLNVSPRWSPAPSKHRSRSRSRDRSVDDHESTSHYAVKPDQLCKENTADAWIQQVKKFTKKCGFVDDKVVEYTSTHSVAMSLTKDIHSLPSATASSSISNLPSVSYLPVPEPTLSSAPVQPTFIQPSNPVPWTGLTLPYSDPAPLPGSSFMAPMPQSTHDTPLRSAAQGSGSNLPSTSIRHPVHPTNAPYPPAPILPTTPTLVSTPTSTVNAGGPSFESTTSNTEPAFRAKKNYADLLTQMLNRKTISNEPLELYYYSKMILLRPCVITGNNAVDCLIAGIENRGVNTLAIKAWLEESGFTEPEQVLEYCKKVDEQEEYVNNNSNSVICAFCQQTGHPCYNCPQSQLKCTKCNLRGHTFTECHKEDGSYLNAQCLKCSEIGHRAFQCPKNNLKCANCNLKGHTDVECYKKVKTSDTFGNTFQNTTHTAIDSNQSVLLENPERLCKDCHKTHNISTTCPNISSKRCYSCGNLGHIKKQCTKINVKGSISTSTEQTKNNLSNQVLKCAKCQLDHHPNKKCFKKVCFNCGESSHTVTNCPKPLLQCGNCFKFGHVIENCTKGPCGFCKRAGGTHTRFCLKVHDVKKCRKCKSFGHSVLECPLYKRNEKDTLTKAGNDTVEESLRVLDGLLEDNSKTQESSQNTNENSDQTSSKTNICHICLKYHGTSECPQSHNTCKRCGIQGHIPDNCPKIICLFCKAEYDHITSDCPLRSCTVCHKSGHMDYNCPTFMCTLCKTTHKTPDCPTFFCYLCKSEGHQTKTCPSRACKLCKVKGHVFKLCPERICPVCKYKGHSTVTCPKLKFILASMKQTKAENASKIQEENTIAKKDTSADNKCPAGEYSTDKFTAEERPTDENPIERDTNSTEILQKEQQVPTNATTIETKSQEEGNKSDNNLNDNNPNNKN